MELLILLVSLYLRAAPATSSLPGRTGTIITQRHSSTGAQEAFPSPPMAAVLQSAVAGSVSSYPTLWSVFDMLLLPGPGGSHSENEKKQRGGKKERQKGEN
ncbi:unnamed protein product [Pleuronectes platessa]|uniref:Uncharacterized protein n=1 Tax=Pleuronectes platessa TaxID=8262 RepID=A0A9N7Y7A4_PLEPL|nr:unnamed protein product [Pleuronectes platessa]